MAYRSNRRSDAARVVLGGALLCALQVSAPACSDEPGDPSSRAGSGGLLAGSAGAPAGHSGTAGGAPNSAGLGGVTEAGGADAEGGVAGVGGERGSEAGATSGAGGDAGQGGLADACGLPLEPDRPPKVRLVNAHSSDYRAIGEPTVPSPLALQLRVNGAPLAGSHPVPQQGPDSVSRYLEVNEGPAVLGVQASSDSSLPAVDAPTPIQLEKGGHYTVISLGSAVIEGISGEIGPGLIVLTDDVSAPCDRARLRFYMADTDALVVDPSGNAALAQSLFVGEQPSAVAVADPRQATPVAGIDVALGTRTFRVSAKDPSAARPTGSFPFTAPSELLRAGRAYYVMSYPSAGRTDGLGERLMFVPVGDDTPPTLVALDPLVLFMNVAPLAAASNLDVLVPGSGRARNLLYLGSEQAKPSNSPTGGLSYAYVQPDGAALTFSGASSEPAPATLLRAETGPLESGQMYLGVVSQAPNGADSALALSLKKLALPLPAPSLPEPTDPDPSLVGQERAIFVNGSYGSPALDFGSFVAKPDNPTQTQFAPVTHGTPYGELSDTRTTLLPIAYLEPLSGGFGARLAVQAGGDAASNRSIIGFAGYFPRYWNTYLYVAVGSWLGAPGNELVQFTLFGPAGANTTRPGPLSPTLIE